MTITVDGVEHLEGEDLDADGFYGMFRDGTPEITTSQPSPGRMLESYERLAARGVVEIVSIHISEAMSGTVGSARVASGQATVPVTVIDTGAASFGVSVCVWAAGVAIARGANIGDIERNFQYADEVLRHLVVRKD